MSDRSRRRAVRICKFADELLRRLCLSNLSRCGAVRIFYVADEPSAEIARVCRDCACRIALAVAPCEFLTLPTNSAELASSTGSTLLLKTCDSQAGAAGACFVCYFCNYILPKPQRERSDTRNLHRGISQAGVAGAHFAYYFSILKACDSQAEAAGSMRPTLPQSGLRIASFKCRKVVCEVRSRNSA